MRVFLIALSLAAMAGPTTTAPVVSSPEPPPLIIFWGDGCPHCEAEWELLAELQDDYPALIVEGHEVWYDGDNQELFAATMTTRGLEARAVPTTLFGERVWVGFDQIRADQITAAVAATYGSVEEPVEISPSLIEVPVVGAVDAGSMPLLASTFLIALVDGFNPCSLWALSILLALVLRSGSRRRVMAVGLMFLGVTTALYGFYIVGMFGALTYAAGAAWVRLSMAAIALVFGLINLKDFFWFKRGPSLTISERAKPRLYARMRHVADAKRPLAGVLAGTAGLAVGVSLLETPCTAGYPLLWANLLSDQGVGWAGAAGLFAVYMAVFLADELAIFGTAVVAMRAAKLEERAGRLLKLIGGALMVTLAITLVAYPAALETLAGAMAVFGFAALAVVVVLGAERVFRGRSRALTR